MDTHNHPPAEPVSDAVDLGALAAKRMLEGNYAPIFTGEIDGDSHPRDGQLKPTQQVPLELAALTAENSELYSELKRISTERDDYKRQAEAHGTISKVLAQRLGEVEYQALHDVDTGLWNKNGLRTIYGELCKRSQREADDSSILFVDLDKFKRYNTLIGHGKTDVFVAAVSTLLQTVLRDGDILGRYGGDEFIAILPNTNLANARIVADKLRDIVKLIKTLEGHKISLTLSVGITSVDSRKSFTEAFEPANAALRLAKKSGRDQTIVLDVAA